MVSKSLVLTFHNLRVVHTGQICRWKICSISAGKSTAQIHTEPCGFAAADVPAESEKKSLKSTVADFAVDPQVIPSRICNNTFHCGFVMGFDISIEINKGEICNNSPKS